MISVSRGRAACRRIAPMLDMMGMESGGGDGVANAEVSVKPPSQAELLWSQRQRPAPSPMALPRYRSH